MKARRSMGIIYRPKNDYPIQIVRVTPKRFSCSISSADQENVPPMDHATTATIKKRKLYNGDVSPSITSPSVRYSSVQKSAVDMEMSASGSTVLGTPQARKLDATKYNYCTPSPVCNRLKGMHSSRVLTTPVVPVTPQLTIQEVMKDVVIYVEVRASEGDRSEQIKSIVAAMGAAVNDKLYRNTTHVVFREGSMTTFKKANKWGIPLVSVSWLEACRIKLMIADPAKYPPINLEPFLNPELYKRVLKANPNASEDIVKTTPERFVLRPQKVLGDACLDRRLMEYQQNKERLFATSPTIGESNFSPNAESTRCPAKSQVAKTPTSMTPLMRRLMIKNADEDRRERNLLLYGRAGTSQLEPGTFNDTISMDISQPTAAAAAAVHPSPVANGNVDSIDLTCVSSPEDGNTDRSLIRAHSQRRTTIHFSNVNMEISTAAIKKNLAVLVQNKETEANENEVANEQSVFNITEETVNGNAEVAIKVPKVRATNPNRSLEEEALRNDVMKAKEQLLAKSVIINKADRRRSLLPSAPLEDDFSRASAVSKTNRRRTLYCNPDSINGTINAGVNAKAIKRRTTLLPATIPEQVQVPTKKQKIAKQAVPTSVTNDKKRKLFSSAVDVSPPPSPVPVKQTCKLDLLSKPLTPGTLTELSSKIKAPSMAMASAGRRSTLDFQVPRMRPTTSNSTTACGGGGSGVSRGGCRSYQKNVIVLTNAKQPQIDFVKEVKSKVVVGHLE